MTLEIQSKYIKIPIKDIEIGERFREDLGDIEELAENIRNVDELLEPVIVTKKDLITEKHTLIAGHRRLLAGQLLGWTEIESKISNLERERISLGEFSENTFRKDWTDSEIYKAIKKVLPILKEAAKERQRQAGKLYGNGKKNNHNDFSCDNNKSKEIACGNFPEAKKGNALDNLSNALGIDRKTLNKIREIGDAAREKPYKYQHLFEKVDSKKISREKAVRIIKKDKLRERKESENLPVNSLPPENRFLPIHDDFTKVPREKLPSRIHLIITDPPYGDKYLPLYEQLAEFSNRELQDGDSLVFITGQITLDKIIQIFSKYPDLKFWWIFSLKHAGGGDRVHPRKVFAKWKPILWYVKGNKGPSNLIDTIPDFIESEKPDKSFHEWAQSEVEFNHIIRYLTVENQVVLDPMMGDGNSIIASIKLNRRCIGIEIDKKRFDDGVNNIKESLYEMNGTVTKNEY